MRDRMILILCLGLVSFSGCGGEEDVAPPVVRPVRYRTIYAIGGQRTRTFSGVTRAGMETKLSFKVAGTISELPVEVGDRVKAGQLIAALDPEDYRLRVQEARAMLDRYQAESRNAGANYERVRALYENQNASLNDLDKARTGAESAMAAVRAAEKKLEMANLQVEYTRLQAPVDGAVASVAAEVNENISAGKMVVTMTSGSHPEVAVAVPELLIAQVRQGDKVKVGLDALPGREFAATVTEVGVSSGEYATTYPVAVRFDGTDDAIRPGMAAEVAFRFGSAGQSERLCVPPAAVAEDRQGRFVFVLGATDATETTVSRRPVVVGDLSGDGLEIVEGLVDGEAVVTAGVSRIHDGQTVRVMLEHEDRP